MRFDCNSTVILLTCLKLQSQRNPSEEIPDGTIRDYDRRMAHPRNGRATYAPLHKTALAYERNLVSGGC